MVADEESACIPNEEAAVPPGVSRGMDHLEFALAEFEDLSVAEGVIGTQGGLEAGRPIVVLRGRSLGVVGHGDPVSSDVFDHGAGIHVLHESNQCPFFRVDVDLGSGGFVYMPRRPEMIRVMVCGEEVAKLFPGDPLSAESGIKSIEAVLMRRACIDEGPLAILQVDKVDIDDGRLSRKGKGHLDYTLGDPAGCSRGGERFRSWFLSLVHSTFYFETDFAVNAPALYSTFFDYGCRSGNFNFSDTRECDRGARKC